MRIDSAGNVGIGTSSPASLGAGYTHLEVNGSASGVLSVSANGVRGLSLAAENSVAGIQARVSGQPLVFSTNNAGTIAERMRITSAGNVGIGTISPATKLQVNFGDAAGNLVNLVGDGATAGAAIATNWNTGNSYFDIRLGGTTSTYTRMRIDSSGNLLVGKTAVNSTVAGGEIYASGRSFFTSDGASPLAVNRLTNDGTLVSLRQDSTEEGTISVSGTTVSYNGGHLSRWAQTTTAKDESLVKGTVLSNLDEMNVYVDADGNPVENEQLNKVKVSDVEGDANVAGVFVNWTYDEAHQVDEINMAMTGDMIIRIAQGVTVARGDLLMSAGDGTAKPQGDDIVRSKTIAKVTSTHVTCTYADGSFCVPCVLMAC
jgi:hypothetical protein